MEKASAAEEAVCRRIIAHYLEMSQFGEWLLRRDYDPDPAVVNAGFNVGIVPARGERLRIPADASEIVEHSMQIVARMQQALSTTLLSAREQLMRVARADALIGKSRAVISESSSVTSGQNLDIEIRAFVAVLADTGHGAAFLSSGSRWWNRYLEG